MEDNQLNALQVILLVSRLMVEKRFDELGDLARRDPRALDQLVSTLRDGRGLDCFLAATGLSKAGPAAVEPLLAALGDDKHPVRQGAALALGDLGDTRALPGLAERLQDDHEAVLQAAALSLGKLRSAEAVTPLLDALHDESERVRRAAVNALGLIGDRRALPELERVAARDTLAVAQRAREIMREMGERTEKRG